MRDISSAILPRSQTCGGHAVDVCLSFSSLLDRVVPSWPLPCPGPLELASPRIILPFAFGKLMRISSRRIDTFEESPPCRLGGLDGNLSDLSAEELGVASDDVVAHFDLENTASLGSLATLDLPLLEGGSSSFDARASTGQEDKSLSLLVSSISQNLQPRQPHPLYLQPAVQV